MIQKVKTPDWWRPFIPQLLVLGKQKELDMRHEWDFGICMYMLTNAAKHN